MGSESELLPRNELIALNQKDGKEIWKKISAGARSITVGSKIPFGSVCGQTYKQNAKPVMRSGSLKN